MEWLIAIYVAGGVLISPPQNEENCKKAATLNADGTWPIRVKFLLPEGATPIAKTVRIETLPDGKKVQVVEPDKIECVRKDTKVQATT